MSNRNRRVVYVAALVAGIAVTTIWTAVASPPAVDTGDPVGVLVPLPTADARSQSLDEATQAVRQSRIQEGSLPPIEQLETLAAAMGVRRNSIQQEATVTVSWVTPLPFLLFRDSIASGRPIDLRNLPPGTAATIYLETDSGYPLTYTNGVSTRLLEATRSYLLGPLSYVSTQYRTEAERRAAVDAAQDAGIAAQDAERRAVILGLSIPFNSFYSSEAAWRSLIPIAAAEVSLGISPAFMTVSDRITPVLIDQWRAQYERMS